MSRSETSLSAGTLLLRDAAALFECDCAVGMTSSSRECAASESSKRRAPESPRNPPAKANGCSRLRHFRTSGVRDAVAGLRTDATGRAWLGDPWNTLERRETLGWFAACITCFPSQLGGS